MNVCVYIYIYTYTQIHKLYIYIKYIHRVLSLCNLAFLQLGSCIMWIHKTLIILF